MPVDLAVPAGPVTELSIYGLDYAFALRRTSPPPLGRGKGRVLLLQDDTRRAECLTLATGADGFTAITVGWSKQPAMVTIERHAWLGQSPEVAVGAGWAAERSPGQCPLLRPALNRGSILYRGSSAPTNRAAPHSIWEAPL